MPDTNSFRDFTSRGASRIFKTLRDAPEGATVGNTDSDLSRGSVNQNDLSKSLLKEVGDALARIRNTKEALSGIEKGTSTQVDEIKSLVTKTERLFDKFANS